MDKYEELREKRKTRRKQKTIEVSNHSKIPSNTPEKKQVYRKPQSVSMENPIYNIGSMFQNNNNRNPFEF